MANKRTVNKLENKTASVIAAIHGITFTLFVIVQAVLSEVLYPILQAQITIKALFIGMEAVISAILYGVLNKLVVTPIYDAVILKKNKNLKIGGHWYHVHIPTLLNGEDDLSLTRLRGGETEIHRDFYDFTFRAQNWYLYPDCDGKVCENRSNTTRWVTKSSYTCGDNEMDIIEIYEANTTAQQASKYDVCPCCKTNFESPVEIHVANQHRYGVHKFDVELDDKARVKKIVGTFSDCWPSLKIGNIYFFKTEEERDARVRQYFADKQAAIKPETV